MVKLKDICMLSLLVFILGSFNSAVYAGIGVIEDAYGGPGGGHGQGKGHGKGGSKNIGKNVGKNKGQNIGQSKRLNKGVNKQANKAVNVNKSNKVGFVNKNRTTISKYYKAKPFPVTTLPPGIAMNLQRGKPLPPGIARVFLPADLVSQLPAYPGYEYLVAGKDVVLVNSTTGVVADILANVLQ
jgi:hypothetical protein